MVKRIGKVQPIWFFQVGLSLVSRSRCLHELSRASLLVQLAA